MIKFVIYKILPIFVLFGGFAGFYSSPLARYLYIMWGLCATTWAFLNLLAIIQTCCKGGIKSHIQAIKKADIHKHNIERAIALCLLCIICFVIENQVPMAVIYTLTVLPYAFIMHHFVKHVERKK